MGSARRRPVSAGLRDARRIVVKVGSALLVDEASGRLRRTWLDALADDLASFRAEGRDLLLVSSGSIALGRGSLGLRPHGRIGRGLKLEESQAAAAAGQIQLAHAYQESLSRHDVPVAQVLLSLGDTEERRRHLNARATLSQLLKLGALPVINENDTVATAEIRYGDNDRLAARVATMVSADTLVLLSDIDGLYTGDPRHDPAARRLDQVTALTPEIEAMAGAAPPGYSSGGMVTKLAAARIAMSGGCRMVIARGADPHPLAALRDGAHSTWFLPAQAPLTARKQWIAGGLKPMGALVIDAGAARALGAGKSLLPAGVLRVEGRFERGDAVRVLDEAGAELARGLSAYGSDDADRIKRNKSSEIPNLLGYLGREELIHRDDLVLSRGADSAPTPGRTRGMRG